MENMPNSLIYRAIDGKMPDKEAQSCYVAVPHNGKVYHLFNAARYPLGRMAEKISIFIRGKHKPIFDNNRVDLGDICVVVNARNLHVTGKKYRQKIYRHHTGYPGGLKEITLDKLVEKNDAPFAVWHAVKGMMPKNKLRETILDRFLIIHDGPFHQQENYKLPQFTEQQ